MSDEPNPAVEILRARYAELQIEQAAIDARMSEVRDMIAQLSTPRRKPRKQQQVERIEPEGVVVEEVL